MKIHTNVCLNETKTRQKNKNAMWILDEARVAPVGRCYISSFLSQDKDLTVRRNIFRENETGGEKNSSDRQWKVGGENPVDGLL